MEPFSSYVPTHFSEDEGASPRRTLFPDTKAMKERIRETMITAQYDAANFYWKTGWCQWLARHPRFENLTLSVITFNALWISVDTDKNNADVLIHAHPVFQVMENFFCTYFFMEVWIRFWAFQSKRRCLYDYWFIFDFLLVTMMVIETWLVTAIILTTGGGSVGAMGNASILRLLRLLRLTRMARMARLLRSMPELLILIRGMVAAIRSVFFTLCLWVLVLYVFGIVFVQLNKMSEVSDDFFSNVPDAMHALLVYGTFNDNLSEMSSLLWERGLHLWLAFYAFVLIAALTIFNMLIGVLCEVISQVGTDEREQIAIDTVKDMLESLLQDFNVDANHDSMISKDEFMKILQIKEAGQCLQQVGVDVVSLVDYSDFIFDEEEEGSHSDKKLDFVEFMDLVLQLRGGNQASVKDMVDLRKFIRKQSNRTYSKLQRMDVPRPEPEELSVVNLPGSAETIRVCSSVAQPRAVQQMRRAWIEQILSAGQQEVRTFLNSLPADGPANKATPWTTLEPDELATVQQLQGALVMAMSAFRSRLA